MITCQEKHSELRAAAQKENMEIKDKALSITSSSKSTEIDKKLQYLKQEYLQRCQHIKKRAKIHFQKYFISIDPVQNKFKGSACMRMKGLKNQAQQNLQNKSKSCQLRNNIFQEWQVTEVFAMH